MIDLEQLTADAAAVFYASDIYQKSYWGKWTGPDRFVSEAAYIAQAAEIARLRAALDRKQFRADVMEAALEPFALKADQFEPVENDDHHDSCSYGYAGITIGMLRRARAALGDTP